MVIKEVDSGEYLDKMSFIDRLGYKLYTKFLSTSSKALICLNEFSDRVIDFCEVGDDLGKYIYYVIIVVKFIFLVVDCSMY